MNTDTTDVLYGSIGRRIKASVLDGILLLAILIGIPVAIQQVLPGQRTVTAIAMWFSILALEPILVSQYGATIGQRICGLKVIRAGDNRHCPLILAFPRFMAKVLLGSFSLIYMLFTRKHQAVHDWLAGTVVVLSPERISRNPDFAREGETEQFLESKYVYPSALRRFLIFLLWFAGTCSGMGIILGMVSLVFFPESIEGEDLPTGIQVIGMLLTMVLLVALSWMGAAGRLPGAKRKPKTDSE